MMVKGEKMKMRSAWVALAAISALSALSGCATNNSRDNEARLNEVRLTETDRLVLARLEENAIPIKQTLNFIERLERGEVEKAHAKAAEGSSGKWRADMLETRLKIVWKDDSAEDLLKQLASKLGVAYRVTGVARPLPPITLEGEALTVRQILERVGDKIDRAADIALVRSDTPAHPSRLELRFK